MRMVTIFLLGAMGGNALAGEILLKVEGGAAGKNVRAALYDTDRGFAAADGRLAFRTRQGEGESVALRFTDLPPGRYALAVYCDLNANGKLDSNLLGMPTEPYGFSRDARSLFGPPDFEQASFDLGDGVITTSVHLH